MALRTIGYCGFDMLERLEKLEELLMARINEQTSLEKWDYSLAIKIPHQIIKELNLKDNQLLTVSVQGDSIVLTPIEKQPTNIHELFADWQDDGQRDRELDWGPAMPNEIVW